MRIPWGCAFVIALGLSAAYGQQAQASPAHTGGTCSGYAAGCLRACGNMSVPAGGCNALCENKRTECMQSGTFVGYSVTFTDVTRQ